MSDDATDRESPGPARRPTHADLRADYDDEYGRVRTPRQIARRRLLIPAIDFLVLGVCGLIASLCAFLLVVALHIAEAADPIEYLIMVGTLMAITAGGGLSALFVVAGDGMLRLRHHRVCLIAAYISTSLSLASVYAILFYPFGIWALVLLYKTEIGREFDKTGETADTRGIPPRAILFMAIGIIVFLAMLLTAGGIATEAEDSGNWEAWELTLAYIVVTVGFIASVVLFALGVLKARRGARTAAPEHPHVPRRPEAGPPAADL